MSELAASAMWGEIHSQPHVWATTIERVTEVFSGTSTGLSTAAEVVLCGCGSAYNCALAAAPVFRAVTGICARAEQAADVALYPAAHLWRAAETLVITLSRSGTTTETFMALRAAQDGGAATLAITCQPDGPVATDADAALVLDFADEQSPTPTRSVSAMMVACQVLAGLAAENEEYLEAVATLPDLGTELLRRERVAEQLAADETIKRFTVLGASHLYGAARECQLKLQETTRLPADAYQTLDYRHGPIAMIAGDLLVILLGTVAGRQYEHDLIGDLNAAGAKTLYIGPSRDVQASSSVVVPFGEAELVSAPLGLPLPQLLAWHKARALGLNPDAPQ